MKVKEFKTKTIDLLKYCLAQTKECAISDGLEDEELKLSEAYCEGLEDAIGKIETLEIKEKELSIVTITYSFDSEVVAVVFDDYKKACDFIKEDFENEKRIDVEENEYDIDEELTFCEEGFATLTTNYNDDVGTTTWRIAREIDRR